MAAMTERKRGRLSHAQANLYCAKCSSVRRSNMCQLATAEFGSVHLTFHLHLMYVRVYEF